MTLKPIFDPYAPANRVKLFVAMLFRDINFRDKALSMLEDCYGKIEASSEVFLFRETDYYRKEMGEGLSKQWFFFRTHVSVAELAEIKTTTNQFEEELRQHAKAPGRVVNIDPGYLELSRVVLASMKDFSHRIYLQKGVFAEITLVYRENAFHTLRWTYPDYRKPEVRMFLEKQRGNFYTEIRPFCVSRQKI